MTGPILPLWGAGTARGTVTLTPEDGEKVMVGGGGRDGPPPRPADPSADVLQGKDPALIFNNTISNSTSETW